MVNSVTFPLVLGGSGNTFTDDDNPLTGLDNDGHRTRLVPMFADAVAIAQTQINAMASPSFTASSVSVNTVGTGNKTFVVAEASRNWAPGMSIRAASSASPANFMDGQITSYVPGTNTVITNVVSISGSGTFSAWSISPSSAVSAPITSQLPGTATANQALFINGTGSAVEGRTVSLTDTFTPLFMPSAGQA